MHNHQTKIKVFISCLAFALLTSFGLTSPHQLEAKDTKEQTATQLEIKKNQIKKTNKQQAEKATETKTAETPKPAENKPATVVPAAPAPKPAPITPDKKKYASPSGHQVMTDGRVVNFRSMGIIYMHGYKYSYYSSKVLYHYRTPEWYACDDHLYRTKEGNIVVASGDHAPGTIVPTPFGPGQVLDHCHRHGVIDIYVDF